MGSGRSAGQARCGDAGVRSPYLFRPSIERMSYDGDRHLLFTGVDRHATSQFDVKQFRLHARIAWQIPFFKLVPQAVIDLHATRVESSGFTEQGAGELSLQVSSQSETVSLPPLCWKPAAASTLPPASSCAYLAALVARSTAKTRWARTCASPTATPPQARSTSRPTAARARQAQCRLGPEGKRPPRPAHGIRRRVCKPLPGQHRCAEGQLPLLMQRRRACSAGPARTRISVSTRFACCRR